MIFKLVLFDDFHSMLLSSLNEKSKPQRKGETKKKKIETKVFADERIQTFQLEMLISLLGSGSI